MRIFVNDSGDLCFAFRYHHWEDDIVIALPDDKATRRRINHVFRATTSGAVLQKALRRLRALESRGGYIPSGYEYASVLEAHISEVVNSHFFLNDLPLFTMRRKVCKSRSCPNIVIFTEL